MTFKKRKAKNGDRKMKRKNVVGLITIAAIAAVVIFAGCVVLDKPAPTPTPTTPSPTPTPSLTPSPTPTTPSPTPTTPSPTPTPSLTPSPTPTTPSPTPTPAITITAPNSGDDVSWREIVEGTSEGVYGSELNIYVLVYPTDAGGPWWVQPDVDVLRDGSWESNCYFGREPPHDKGAHFRVRVIITMQKLSEGQQWQKLPDHIAISETIKVTRA